MEQGLEGAVLAALQRLETRLSVLEERVESLSLTGQADPAGPSTSLDAMLEDVLVKLYQIENRVDSIEKRQEKEREEKEKRRNDKRRAATALLRQQALAMGQPPMVTTRASAAIAPLRAVPPRPPAKKPPSLPSPRSSTPAAVIESPSPAIVVDDTSQHEQPDDHPEVDSSIQEQQQPYGEESQQGESQESASDEVGRSSVEHLLSVKKPLPAFPSPTSRRRMKSMTTYIPLSQSSELLLQLAEMELQEQAGRHV